MKNIASLAVNIIITVILSVSLIMCFSTAFNIETNSLLLISCAIIFTLVISLISYYIKSGKKFTGALAVIQVVYIAVFFASYNTIISQLNYAANRVLGVYSKYMSVPSSINIAAKSGAGTQTSDATVLFIFILFILCEIFSVSLIRIKKSIIIYILSLVALVPCFVMVTTLPSLTPLILSISILLALYITGFIRKYNANIGSIILSATSVLLAVTILILCAIFPLQEFERYEWQDTLLSKFNELLNIDNGGNQLASQLQNLRTNIQDSQNLNHLGEFRLNKTPVLSIMSEENKVIYLKKISYADYEDNQWKILSKDEIKSYPNDFNAFNITISDEADLKELYIKALYREELIYTTYYSKTTEYAAVGDTCIENIDNTKEYMIEYYQSNSDSLAKNESDKLKEYEDFVYNTYTKLPDKTKERLLKIANENGISQLNTNEIPNAVKKFVSGRGEYSFVPDALPEGEDFAPWFIENSSKGYCIHYATAATTMLRALGIPARYATGYFVLARKDEFVDVTNCNSHAWVEYYDDSKGWMMLDPTPPIYLDNGNGNTDSTDSSAGSNSPVQTEPSILTPTEQPTTNKSDTVPYNTEKNSDNNNKGFKIPPIIQVILIILFIIVLIVLRAKIIRKNRKKLFETRDNKKRIIYIYRYAMQINNITEGFIPIEVQNLVNEAKYSNHIMSEKSVKIVKSYAEHERKELYKMTSGIKRLYYKYIKAY